jgi:glucan phosphoethanolaminetransferase (alkaline phosphatase superfamily)
VFLVDCLRADHLSLYGYHRETTPFLARLREEGRLRQVAQARAACNCTPCGVMSALASREQADLGQGMFSLHDVLHDRGYRTHFILAGWHDVWYDLRALYGTSIDYYYEGTQTERYLPDDDLLLLEGLEPVPASDGRPAFFYFHLMSAHDTGVYGPEFSRWQPALTFQLGGTFSLRGNDPVKSGNTYDNKLLKADRIIEQLFGALDQKGYLRDSMVVILGDHGQGLGEHGHYGHGRRLYEEDLRIPLLIVDDPAVSYRHLSTALQADVAPTILDRLDLPVPATWTGRSLLAAGPGPSFSTHYGCMGGNHAAVFKAQGKNWKLIRGRADGEELYELGSDPSERRNLVAVAAAGKALARGRALLDGAE